MFLNAENIDTFLNCQDSDNFKIDDFISNVRKYNDLKTTLEELKSYLKVLSQKINKRINEDYIDYIILSSNIANIDKYIKNISASTEKLKNAVFKEKSCIDKALMLLNDKMSEKNSVKKSKYLNKYAMHILIKVEKINNLNVNSCLQNTFLTVLESEAFNLSIIQFYLDESSFCETLLENMKNNSEILKEIETKLETYLLYFIQENDFENLLKVIHTYSMLNKRKEAETIICQMYIKPFTRKYVTEINILQHGIVKVYDDALNFVSQFCANIELAWENEEKYPECLTDYDFITDVIWLEILQEIVCILPVHTSSPGDAQKFHADYSATSTFLQRFEECFKKLTSIKRMREHNVYKTFIKKWNLEAYFKIRFIEIAGRFEQTLLFETHGSKFIKNEDSPYLLRPSKVLIECLSYCWDDNIFLRPLSHEFWKLSLQLISRYNEWKFSYVKNLETKSILFYQIVVSIIVDSKFLIKKCEKLYINVISSKIDKLTTELAFSSSLKTFKKTALHLEKSLIESLTKQICFYIVSVTDIPRLYLKTNRGTPETPSPYIAAIRNFISEFLSVTDSLMTKELKKSIIDHVAISLIEEWSNSVHDVMMSVKKMEESFKILKRVKNKPTMETKSDYEKMKMQFMLDADTIEELLRLLEIENTEKIKIIKEFIEQN